MHSVTSGAVYSELVSGSSWTYIKSGMGTGFMYKKIGNFVWLRINTANSALKFTANATYMKYADDTDVVLPSQIIPNSDINFLLIDNTFDTTFHARIFASNGKIRAWKNLIKEVTDVASWNLDLIYKID